MIGMCTLHTMQELMEVSLVIRNSSFVLRHLSFVIRNS